MENSYRILQFSQNYQIVDFVKFSLFPVYEKIGSDSPIFKMMKLSTSFQFSQCPFSNFPIYEKIGPDSAIFRKNYLIVNYWKSGRILLFSQNYQINYFSNFTSVPFSHTWENRAGPNSAIFPKDPKRENTQKTPKIKKK